MREIIRLLSYVKKYILIFCAAVLSMLMLAFFTSALTVMFKPIFEEMLISVPDKSSSFIEFIEKWGLDRIIPATDENIFIWIPVTFVALFILKGIFAFFSEYLMSYIGNGVVNDLRVELFRNIQFQRMGFFSSHSTGLLISRVISDVERIQITLSEKLAEFIREFFILVGLLAVIFYINAKLAFFVIIVAPLSFYPLIRFAGKLRRVSHRSQEKMAELSNILKETIVGKTVVKAFGMESREVSRFSDSARQLFRVNMKSALIMAFTSPLMEVLGAVAAAFLIWYFYTQIKVHGVMTLGDFAAFTGAAFQLYSPVKRLAKSNNYIQQAIAAATRVFEILDKPVENLEEKGSVELKEIGSGVEFRDVSFDYGGGEILMNVNIKAPTGSVTAFVGASGSGKSTLVSLLPRFYDVSSGAVLIGGKDIRTYSIRSLRSQIGIVTQETRLFNDTIYNNIAYGMKNAAEDIIREACSSAYINEFTDKLEKGLDYEIGEEGGQLSGGQRQRIAIARAILRNPPILILDEATSALDAESEQMVQKAISNLMKGRTVFVIAHRMSTVKAADCIHVVERGRIMASGRHGDLMKGSERYRELYELQFREEIL